MSEVPSELPVFGPDAVRVVAVRSASAEVRFDVVGPKGARYGLRDAAGKKGECRQVELGEVASRPPGLPATSNWQTELICAGREKVTKASRVLVKVALDSFTYDFEVPALPAA
ncbi:hypothetical protein AB0C22_12780 [Micromonospora sp. NPDC048894]|uniref:Uncharacterized protein n=1 Tax=Micromonospora antibiotica TaxID=2807623 RepID=A0ABS3VB99_9ACTN|nr:hypothetical protein [Micromonospora antibiotica]